MWISANLPGFEIGGKQGCRLSNWLVGVLLLMQDGWNALQQRVGMDNCFLLNCCVS